MEKITAEKIMDAVGELPEDLIGEVIEEKTARKRSKKKIYSIIAMAACLCLVVVALRNMVFFKAGNSESSAAFESTDSYTVSSNDMEEGAEESMVESTNPAFADGELISIDWDQNILKIMVQDTDESYGLKSASEAMLGLTEDTYYDCDKDELAAGDFIYLEFDPDTMDVTYITVEEVNQ